MQESVFAIWYIGLYHFVVFWNCPCHNLCRIHSCNSPRLSACVLGLWSETEVEGRVVRYVLLGRLHWLPFSVYRDFGTSRMSNTDRPLCLRILSNIWTIYSLHIFECSFELKKRRGLIFFICWSLTWFLAHWACVKIELLPGTFRLPLVKCPVIHSIRETSTEHLFRMTWTGRGSPKRWDDVRPVTLFGGS